MANPGGQIGYEQTAITNVLASVETPESKAMTDSPAIMSQKNKDNSANTCETINQIKTGLHDRKASFGSNAILRIKVTRIFPSAKRPFQFTYGAQESLRYDICGESLIICYFFTMESCSCLSYTYLKERSEKYGRQA